MKYVMAVTNDEYELPVLIEKSYKAMARKTGYSEQTISRQCRGIIHSSGKMKFVKVEYHMEKLIKEMEDMVADVNVNEIADHLKEESLWNWCGAWREEAKRILKDMRKELQ